VSAFHNSRELGGQFQIVATAKPGVKLEDLEKAIDEEIAKLKTESPTGEEMERAYNARESAFVYGLQTVGGFGGKSDQLNAYAVFLNQPDYFQTDLLRYRSVKPADVMSVAGGYLTDKRLVLTVTPRQKGKTTGDPAPTSPTAAIATPSQQTGAPAGTATTTTPAARTGGTTPAGVQPQTKTEAGATTPAGAAPPATTAKRSADKTQDKSQLGGLYAQPKPKPDPSFKLPQVQRHKLSNGLEVLIVEQHELPVVNMNLVVRTGGAADPQNRAGLASLTAALIDEGTKSRSALDISNQLATIGARLGTGSDFDSGGLNLLTLSKHMDRALEIYADVVTNPSFPESELDLQRKSRLASLMQRRDDANAIAGVVYSSLLYGRNHPYGHPAIGDEQSVGAITNDDVMGFYQTYYRPNNAALIVTGDVTPATLMPKLERAFANWKRGEVPAVNIEMPPMRDKATLYIVDKPGAAQSVITIGQVGQARSTPDYFPLIVMNTMLGGQFTSRVNMNLREEKGYTYGARTSFDYRRSAGPFAATAGVQTSVTKESVFEFLKELRGIRGERPVTPTELEFSKQAIIRGFPRTFETPEQMANRLTDIVVYNLPDDYFNNYIARVRAVSVADINRVANRYLDPSKMAILVVGDRKVIEPGLRSLTDVGTTVTFVDPEGRPATDGSSGGGSVEGGGTRR
nr:insulinase family protein [Acidobacteriota bacterium]